MVSRTLNSHDADSVLEKNPYELVLRYLAECVERRGEVGEQRKMKHRWENGLSRAVKWMFHFLL